MGLLRGVARTAVVAGTATAVSGRVQRRQAEKYAERDQQIYASRAEGWSEGAAAATSNSAPPPTNSAPPPTSSAPPSTGPQDDMLTQLKRLGELHESGVLTDEEFAAQKAKLLG